MQKKPFMTFALILLTVSLTASCAVNMGINRASTTDGRAVVTSSDDDYEKLGISRSQVEPWEDGMRTTGGKGNYEWWYFDSTLKDGSTLVVVFYTKNSLKPQTLLQPRLTVEYTRPDGTSLHKELKVDAGKFSAAKDHCDVRIGANTFTGNLHDYTLHIDVEGLQADITLHGTVPPWRPGTGHAFFHDKKEHFFAWLPSVPQGTIDGTLTIDGQSRHVAGVGYHDHNWGNVSLLELLHNWYWGRAQIGNYSVIASHMIAVDKYGNAPLPVFMLACDGKIIADDASKVTFSANNVYSDPHTGKPVAGIIIYDYNDGTNHYRITFERERDLINERFIDKVRGFQYVLARLAGFDGAYLRFTGKTTIERFDGDKIVETIDEKGAVWELMYFGQAPKK
jgi:predicted secreted hydrolase